DSTDFMYHSTHVFDSNTHSIYEQHTYYHSTQDSLLLISSDWNKNAFCPVTTYDPLYVVTGGCPPYNYQWSPSTGLSSNTVLNPQITLQDTMQYTLTYSDQNGHSASEQITF